MEKETMVNKQYRLYIGNHIFFATDNKLVAVKAYNKYAPLGGLNVTLVTPRDAVIRGYSIIVNRGIDIWDHIPEYFATR